MTRDKLEALVWKLTHKDYRGTTEGVRHVLHQTSRGTTSSPLSALTDLQLRALLPRAKREEIYGPDPLTTDERMKHYRAVSYELGHLPQRQGHNYECSRCGASGRTGYSNANTLVAYGAIFTDRCGA